MSAQAAFVFVGEQRSPTAIRRGWTWKDGRLAAKTLHEALRAAGIEPARQVYVNLWSDGGELNLDVVAELLVLDRARLTLVALGRRVADNLARFGVSHVEMVHPAARGSIRRSERYQAHVASVLGGAS